MSSPSPNGSNGASNRDAGGRFRKGNPGGPGNPLAKKVGQLRAALVESVSPEEVKEVVARIVELAKGGDVPAMKLLFDRILGPPIQADYEERLATLEQLVESKSHPRHGGY